ncbi:hypothetical protein ACFVWF_32990 [Rhodococcus qingshengii]|uniref:hypothetical protein n=1 Tax=Rhodococcus qingshengii TaxID=334542 RepID=UPI0036DAAF42
MVSFGFSVGKPVYGIFLPTGAVVCAGEDADEEGVPVVAVVVDGNAEVEGAAADGLVCSEPVASGAHVTAVGVVWVVVVGAAVVVVVVVLDATAGSHTSSGCEGISLLVGSLGCAKLAVTGVVTKNSAVIENVRARAIVRLRVVSVVALKDLVPLIACVVAQHCLLRTHLSSSDRDTAGKLERFLCRR